MRVSITYSSTGIQYFNVFTHAAHARAVPRSERFILNVDGAIYHIYDAFFAVTYCCCSCAYACFEVRRTLGMLIRLWWLKAVVASIRFEIGQYAHCYVGSTRYNSCTMYCVAYVRATDILDRKHSAVRRVAPHASSKPSARKILEKTLYFEAFDMRTQQQ